MIYGFSHHMSSLELSDHEEGKFATRAWSLETAIAWDAFMIRSVFTHLNETIDSIKLRAEQSSLHQLKNPFKESTSAILLGKSKNPQQ